MLTALMPHCGLCGGCPYPRLSYCERRQGTLWQLARKIWLRCAVLIWLLGNGLGKLALSGPAGRLVRSSCCWQDFSRPLWDVRSKKLRRIDLIEYSTQRNERHGSAYYLHYSCPQC